MRKSCLLALVLAALCCAAGQGCRMGRAPVEVPGEEWGEVSGGLQCRLLVVRVRDVAGTKDRPELILRIRNVGADAFMIPLLDDRMPMVRVTLVERPEVYSFANTAGAMVMGRVLNVYEEVDFKLSRTYMVGYGYYRGDDEGRVRFEPQNRPYDVRVQMKIRKRDFPTEFADERRVRHWLGTAISNTVAVRLR